MGSPSKPGRCKQLSQRKHRLQKYKGISVTIHITCKLVFLSSQVFFNRSSICMQAQKTNLTVFPKTLVVSCKMTLFSLFIYFNCCFFPLSCWWILSFFSPLLNFTCRAIRKDNPLLIISISLRSHSWFHTCRNTPTKQWEKAVLINK